MMDQIDRTGTLTSRMIICPAGPRSSQVKDAGALVAGRTAGKISATECLTGGREARLRKQRRQPFGCRGTKLLANFVEVVPKRWLPDLIEVDHDRITNPLSARVMTV